MKKCLRLYKDAETRGWTRNWQVTKVGTTGELKSHASCCTTGQKSKVGQAVNPRLRLATQSSYEAKSPKHPVCYKTNSLHSIHTLLYIDPYTHEM